MQTWALLRVVENVWWEHGVHCTSDYFRVCSEYFIIKNDKGKKATRGEV